MSVEYYPEYPGEPTVPDPLLNTDEACAHLGVPKATLLTWRVRRPGYGPRAIKVGGRLKYRRSELDRWLESHEETFTEEEVEAAQAIEVNRFGPGHRAVRTRSRANRVTNRFFEEE
ncbi:helix-turn-helix domain-containing protein [Nocardioides sp. YIM 152588]|uniref:helix-turn-helix transcriptional regulator n=1 Tax=Nocardioides sp. YIM 152588 TaxID=3158259 RepID=UPI0032E422B8